MNWKKQIDQLRSLEDPDYPIFIYEVTDPKPENSEIKDLVIQELYSVTNGGLLGIYHFLPIEEVLNKDHWREYTKGLFTSDKENPLLKENNYPFAKAFENIVFWNSDADEVSILYLEAGETESLKKSFIDFMDMLFDEKTYEDGDLWKETLTQLKC